MDRNEDVYLLGTGGIKLYEEDSKEVEYLPPITDKELRRILSRYNPFLHSSVMIRAKAFEEVGLYNENLNCAIDYELWIRIAKRFKIACLPDLLVMQRFHSLQYFAEGLEEEEHLKTHTNVSLKAAKELNVPIYLYIPPIVNYAYARLPYKFRQVVRGTGLNKSIKKILGL